MSERISSCENLCRDFWWFWNLDPRIIQGLLNIGAAAIAAAVALYIAIKVYPLQKEKDRDIKIDEEKRLVFRDYLKSVDAIVNQRLLMKHEAKLKAFQSCKSSLNELLIFADKETAKKMWQLYLSASLLSNALSNQPQLGDVDIEAIYELQEKANVDFKDAVNSARKELGVEELVMQMDLAILSSKRADED